MTFQRTFHRTFHRTPTRIATALLLSAGLLLAPAANAVIVEADVESDTCTITRTKDDIRWQVEAVHNFLDRELVVLQKALPGASAEITRIVNGNLDETALDAALGVVRDEAFRQGFSDADVEYLVSGLESTHGAKQEPQPVLNEFPEEGITEDMSREEAKSIVEDPGLTEPPLEMPIPDGTSPAMDQFFADMEPIYRDYVEVLLAGEQVQLKALQACADGESGDFPLRPAATGTGSSLRGSSFGSSR